MSHIPPRRSAWTSSELVYVWVDAAQGVEQAWTAPPPRERQVSRRRCARRQHRGPTIAHFSSPRSAIRTPESGPGRAGLCSARDDRAHRASGAPSPRRSSRAAIRPRRVFFEAIGKSGSDSVRPAPHAMLTKGSLPPEPTRGRTTRPSHLACSARRGDRDPEP